MTMAHTYLLFEKMNIKCSRSFKELHFEIWHATVGKRSNVVKGIIWVP